MTVGVIIALITGTVGLAWVVWLVVQDRRIQAEGRDVRVLVEEARVVARNDSSSVTVRYRLSWSEGGRVRRVEGTETIGAHRMQAVRAGEEVTIRYLDDGQLRFVFDR
ncbi:MULTISPECIES: DUF3592 domain-containing protein [Microbacterium]|uniref:DUF3592 domain-containing protein n=1 Tax=Microbacterium TaxID=33882 RepID=UPI0022F03525|nr:hypothetical protein [Streptomyces sp. MS2A]